MIKYFAQKCILLAILTLSQNLLATQFVVLGDTGKGNDGQKLVSEALQKHCSNGICEFGIMTGDNIYGGSMKDVNDPIMKRLFADYYEKLQFPMYMTLGNHDYGDLNYIWHLGKMQVEYSKLNPQFVLPNTFYFVEKENEIIAVIDTTRILYGHDISEQAIMLREAYALAKAKNKWFIVSGHHPYISNDEYGNAGLYKDQERWIFKLPIFSGIRIKEFVEENICGKADIYFCGHDHSLQVLDGNIKQCPTLMIVSGAGASASHLMKSRNPILFQGSTLGFFSLQSDNSKINIQALDEKLNLLYSMSLTDKKHKH